MRHARSFIIALSIALATFYGPTAHAQTVTDPVGDTFGTGKIEHDLTSISAVTSGGTLTFSGTFADTITAPSSLSDTDLFGYIDIDSDQNPNTGGLTVLNNYGPGPNPNLGVDYYLDLGSEQNHAGAVDVVQTSTGNVVGTAPITYAPFSFSTAVPLSLLGNSTGQINYGILVASPYEATDKAFYVAPTPEPSALAALSLGGLGLCGLALRAQRRVNS